MQLSDVIKRNVSPETWRAIRRMAWPIIQRRRLRFAMSYIRPSLKLARVWARSDGENSNFLYALTPINRMNPIHTLPTSSNSPSPIFEC